MTGAVATVIGDVPAEKLGVTLTHEHCLIDLRTYWKRPAEIGHRVFAETRMDVTKIGAGRRNPLRSVDNLILGDVDVAVDELMEFQKIGGRTIVDLTPPDIGRDAEALQAIARRTGLHVIAGCGHYIQMAHPPSVADEEWGSIAARLICELSEGIGETSARAGVIGELGTSNPIHPDERKVLRAAAHAHRETGAPIAVHLSPPPRGGAWLGQEVLDLLESEGVDAARVLLCHLDNALEPGEGFLRAVEQHEQLARRGCFIGYDGCGKEHYFPSGSRASYPSFWCPSDRERACAAAMLLERGLADHLLLSHDVCFKIELMGYGGFGYGHILRTFVSNLRDYGIPQREIARLLINNPRRFLTPSV